VNKPASHQVERAIGLLADAIAAELWTRLIDDSQERAPGSLPQPNPAPAPSEAAR